MGNAQQGSQKGLPQRADDEATLEEDPAGQGEQDDERGDVETGVANDAGTIPGRKVDHSNPHDIPPRGMKREYER